MNHSATTVSDIIKEIHECDRAINDSLLIGEQVTMINEAACIYNLMRNLITPEYLSDEEFEWLKEVADGWNVITRAYNKQLSDTGVMTEDMQDNLDDLSDALRVFLDDLRDMGADYDGERPC